MQIKIRKFINSDAKNVANLMKKTFNEFVASSYTKKGRKLWSSGCTSDNLLRSKTKSYMFVALSGKKIAGIIRGQKDNSRLATLFVDKKYHSKGIARQLVGKIEKIYIKKGFTDLKVWSSKYAIKFYERLGFKNTARFISKNGKTYQPMKKMLKIK